MGDSVKKYRQRRGARIRKRLDDFREGDHPRDENGRFTSGGGGGNMPSGVRASLGKVGSGKAYQRTKEAVETANLADDVRREFRSEKMREPDIGKGWAESRRKKAATSFKTVLNRIPDGEEFELTPKRGGGEVFKFKKQGQRYKGTYNGKNVDLDPTDLFNIYVKNNNYGMKFKSYAEQKRLRGDADMDAVEKYRKRRAARLGDRMDADDDDGRWVTTEKKHKVHINAEGEPDKGNPHVIKTMKSGGGSLPKKENKTVSLGYQKYDLEKMTDEWKKRGYSEEGARERAEKEFKELENMADHKRGERGETYSSGKEAGDIARGTMVRMRPEWRRPEEGDKEYIMLEDYGDRALVGVANSNLALGSAETVGKEMIDVAMKDGKQFMHPRYEAQQKAKEAAAKPKKRKTAADKYKDRIASAPLDMEELNKIVEEAAKDNKISGPKYGEIYQAALDRVKNSGEQIAKESKSASSGGGSNGMVDAAKAEAKKLGTSTQMKDGDLYVATTTKQFNPSSTRGSHRIWGKVVDKPSPGMKHRIGDFGNFEAYSKGFWGEGDNDSYGYEFVLKKPKKNDGRMDDEEWITMNGTHVQIGDDGQVSKGPEAVKNVIKQSGGYKKGTKKPRASGSTGFKTVAEFKKALNDRNVAMAEKVNAEEAWKEAKAFRASMWDDEVGGRKSLGSLKKDISKYKKAGDKEKLEKAKHDYDRMKAWTDERGEDLNKAVEDAEKKMNEATKAYEEIDKRINDFSESRKTPDTPELARPAKNAGTERPTGRMSSEAVKAEQRTADRLTSRIGSLPSKHSDYGRSYSRAADKLAGDISGWFDSLGEGTEITLGKLADGEPWTLKKVGNGKWTGFAYGGDGIASKNMAEHVINHLGSLPSSAAYGMKIKQK